jgi:murein peptide amidase A
MLHDIVRVERLGKNHGGYHGETIDIRAVLRDVHAAAQISGWTSETFYQTADYKYPALRRTGLGSARRVYLSTGIHGDEPAGPMAMLRLLEENNWPLNLDLWLCPCLNPMGFRLNRRESAEGIDLNRDYRDPKSAEVRAHIAWLERQPEFDLYLCLHEDWESQGFYIYEQNPDARPSLAERIVSAVSEVCPIDLSETIEGRAAQDGIVRPNIQPQERPDWPEAFYLIMNKARQGYTLEAPSDFPLGTRVGALVAGVDAVMKLFA